MIAGRRPGLAGTLLLAHVVVTAALFLAFGGYRNQPSKIESDGKYYYQFLLSLWFEQGEGLGEASFMPSEAPGFMTRKEAVERYGQKSGRDMSKIDFYYIFGVFKMAVVMQQIYFRYAKGQTHDERFKMGELGAEFLMSLAWGRAKGSEL